ncbi:aminotransferase class III-fold pyridoxal phosphate-dependent enzyme [Streptomyces sp. RKND-216]|nr:aminotransferase class III-fold pyridoxal phosphate-dependent enzyme [Streptomyces sp. RKND-216]
MPVSTTVPGAWAEDPSTLVGWIARSVAERAGLPEESVDPTTPFADCGLSSRDAVALIGDLQTHLSQDLSPALMWEHPTPQALGTHLAGGPSDATAPHPPPRLRTDLPAVEKATSRHEAGAVAVIGMGCRFPGSDGPAALWRHLIAGNDLVSAPGTRRELLGDHGPLGLLDDVAGFDAEFFSLSGREAAYVDPQQRLLLETAWEALEDAGIPPRSLAGSTTGVFVGISASDYGRLQGGTGAALGPYSGSGQSLTMAANRLSYLLDLGGPSMAVDTACSSSLVAVHLACRSLRSGECDTAVAGGVNLILTPDTTEIFTRAGMMAGDGRCKTFDAAADGYVRAEGCGVVVLKRLTDALRDGDPVLAVIRGTAVNQDGRSNGLTAPSGEAQRRVIRDALRDAGIQPARIGYVEAHGTGTPLGDPVETRALSAVLTEGRRPDDPLLTGSVKTNIGHAESAAGMAGLIKTVLALRHGVIPPHLHLKTPNPRIDTDGVLRIPTVATPWPEAATPRAAGVSSFGFGGTNAHVVVTEAPEADDPAAGPGGEAGGDATGTRRTDVLTLSARTPEALHTLVDRYARVLRDPAGPAWDDVCHTAGSGRTHFAHRFAVAAGDAEEAATRAEQWLATGRATGTHSGQTLAPIAPVAPGGTPAGGVAFLFGGQGTQYPGMGRRLLETSPAFRRALEECDEIAAAHLGRTVTSLLPVDSADADLLARTRYTQPVLFAVGYALAALWRSRGVEPAYVLGHSAGSLAAACVAGVFGPEDGLRLAAERGRLIEERCDEGRMLVVLAAEATVREVLAGLNLDGTDPSKSVIACVNGESNVVVSGTAAGVDAARRAFAARDVVTRDLPSEYAFHSPLMAPARAAFLDVARTVEFAAPRIPFVSDTDGRLFDGSLRPDADHWARHLEEPVRFADGLRALAAEGCTTFLEAGPGRTLGTAGRRTVPGALWLCSLREGADDQAVLADAVAGLYVAGHPVDREGAAAGRPPRRVAGLPTYPFKRSPHWLPSAAPQAPALPAAGLRPAGPPSRPRTEGPLPVAHRPNESPAQGRVLSLLTETVGRLLENPEAADPDASFLELGADSLTLMHTLQAVQRTFGVRLPVAKLFDELNTPRLLAEYVEAQAPLAAATADPAGAEPPEPATRVAAPGTPAGETAGHGAPGGDAVEHFLSVHARVMDQAYALLRGSGRPLPPAAAASPATAPAEAGLRTEHPHEAPVAAPLPRAAPDTFVPFRQAPASGTAAASGSVRAEGRDGEEGSRRAYVAALVERYCARTAESKAQAVRERVYHADVRHAPQPHLNLREARYPLVVTRSEGSRVWDADGNAYLDLTMGFGVNFFGHREPFIEQALTDQLARGMHLGPHNDLAAETAELVCELTSQERTVFCNTGSEAVMVAVRLARAVTGRSRVALFAGAYHGSADPILAVQNPDGSSAHAVPLAPGIPEEVAANALVLPYDDPASLQALRDHAGELAAVLVEPVQSRRPDIQPGEFLRELRELTRQADVPLIFDEVITGFRMHPGGAQALFGVRADLAVYGKVMGGGMPIGAVAGRAKYLDPIDGGAWTFGDAPYRQSVRTFFSGTFCKHPLALAAGRAVLRELKRRGPALQESVSGKVAALASAVNGLFEAADVPVRLTAFGSLFRFRFLRETALSETVEVFHTALAEKGIYVWEGRNCFLSTAHTDEDVATLVAALAETADEMTEAGFFPGARTIHPPASLPPGDAQHELWLLAQTGEDASRAYNESVRLDLRGRLDLSALREAVQAVVARHEGLRTVFSPDEGRQRVLSVDAFDVPLVRFGASGTDAAGWADAAAWADEVFDLEAGPLVRAAVERLDDTHHRLHLTAHHTVVDGWAFRVVLEEIGRLYSAAVGTDTEPLPPARQFRELVQREHERRSGERLRAHERFWLDTHADPAPALRLPTDRPRPARSSSEGASVTVTLEDGLSRRIASAGSRLGCTPFTLLLSAYAGLLHRLTGADDVVIGVPVAQRDEPGADRVVGNCSSVLPLRSRPAPDASVRDVTVAMQRHLAEAFAHGDCSFAAIASRLPQGTEGPRRQLHATLFNLDQAPEPPALAGLEVSLGTPGRRHVKCDLAMDVLQEGERYHVTVEYRTDLFDAATVRGYADAYTRLLETFLAAPDGPAPLTGPLRGTGTRTPPVVESPAVESVPPVPAAETMPDAPPAYRAPRNATEATLLAVWQEVTGSQDAGTDDDFFALGGHSLQAVRVVAAVRERLGATMPARWLFENPTVAALAARLGAGDTVAAPPARRERPDILPLSHAQQRLWFLGRLEGPSSTYNLPLPLRLTGPLDTEALTAALGDVVARHEPLRTVFEERRGVPRQHILPVEDVPAALAKRTLEPAELDAAVRQAAAHPFDLADEVPLKGSLFELGEQDHVLLLVLHHAAGDGWSLPVLARDLTTAYTARRAGRAPDWAPLEVQYADYTLWQAERLGSAKDPESLLSRQLGFWREALAGLPDEITLPADRPRPRVASHRGGQVRFTVDERVHAALSKLAQESRASVFMVTQAALAVLLDRLGAGTDVPIGTPVAGRPEENLEDLVGFFVNTLVLRTDTSGEPTFRRLVERVRDADLAALAHQDVPFEQLVQALNPPRSRARHPLFQVMLGFETEGPLELKAAGLRITEEPDPTDVAKFDLFLSVRELRTGDGGPAGLSACLEYSTDLFDPATARTLTARLNRLLTAFATDPDLRCADPALDPENPEYPENLEK